MLVVNMICYRSLYLYTAIPQFSNATFRCQLFIIIIVITIIQVKVNLRNFSNYVKIQTDKSKTSR